MSDFTCPNCRGGFPKDVVYGDLEENVQPACPWCEESLSVPAMATVR